MKRIICSAIALLAVISLSITTSAQDAGHFQGVVSGDYKTIGLQQRSMANVSLGWRFDRGNYLGIGSGMHWIKHWYQSEDGPKNQTPYLKAIPLYADYIHYFHFGKSLSSFYLGLEAGGSYLLDKDPCHKVELRGRVRAYFNPKLGFDIGFTRDIGLILGVGIIAVPVGSEYMLAPTVGIRF